MKIIFHQGWLSGASARKSFKSSACAELFTDYLDRIRKFTACETAPAYDFSAKMQPGETVWVCDFHPKSRMLKSEELADKIDTTAQNGTRILRIVIGGADGFSTEERKLMRADLIWSFGPQTLPHELAAVIAGEQIYRAWTILRNLPYHSGH